MSPDRRIVLGSSTSEHLSIKPRRRSHPHCQDYWDGNWLSCAIDVRVGAFSGSVNAELRAEELVVFRNALGGLYDRLAGEATFDTREHWLMINIIGDGRGHFEAKCELRDAPGIGNRLEFTLAFDQTDLPPMVAQLDAMIAAFPVIGRP